MEISPRGLMTIVEITGDSQKEKAFHLEMLLGLVVVASIKSVFSDCYFD